MLFPFTSKDEYLLFTGTEFPIRHAGGECESDRPRQKAASCVNLANSIDEDFVRHALDEVAHGAGLQRLVDVFISFIGREHNDSRGRSGAADGANGLGSTGVRKPQVHQGDIRMMLLEHADGFLRGASLSDDPHVWLGLDDGGNADLHDGVIVAYQDVDECAAVHISIVSTFAVDCKCERCSVKRTTVPCWGRLAMSNWPPKRSIRSRIPAMP